MLFSLLFRREDFKTFIKIKKTGPLYFIDLEVGNNFYKNLLIDTGSAYLLLKGYKPGKNVLPVSNKLYDIYTVYGGKNTTIDQCISKNNSNSIESCGIHKLYNDMVYGNTVTICDVIHGNAYNILGMTCLSSQEQSNMENNSLINWKNKIKNFTINFKTDIMMFNDSDKDFIFVKRIPIIGYFTDFYAIKDYSEELGEIIISFDTGASTTFIPKNIVNSKHKSFHIRDFNIYVPSYEILNFDANFIILGIDSMEKFSKFYFSKDVVGYRK